jgi:hypothetical protein
LSVATARAAEWVCSGFPVRSVAASSIRRQI